MSKAKILVIRGGAIGDFILTLPAIAALRRQFPVAHLEVMGYPHIANLAAARGLVDRVQPIEARPLAGFFARNGELSEDLRDYFSEFDIVISYLFDPDEIFQANVRRCLHGQFIQGPHRPDETNTTHATAVYLKPLERLAIFDADATPRLHLSPRTSHLSPPLALHPGSGSEKKNWPEALWMEFIERLVADTAFEFLLVGGEAEGMRLWRLAAKLPAKRFALAQSLPLPELASRLETCAAFVGHDSGITHLAAALGLPCLVLWADSNQEIWQPRGERIKVMRESRGLQHLGAQAVAEELKRLLNS